MSLHDADPRVKEVLDEDRVLGVVGFEDGGEEGGDLLGLWGEGDRLACGGVEGESAREIHSEAPRCVDWNDRRTVVVHLDAVSLVLGREEDSVVLEGLPL